MATCPLHRTRRSTRLTGCLVVIALAGGSCVSAERLEPGRLLATSGATPIEGGGGGGVVPWAVIAGYGSEDAWGGSAFVTRVETEDYALTSAGVALGWRNRVELSLTRQSFGLPTLADALGLPVRTFRQDILGLKWRVAGDLIYTPWPQFSVGLQHKRQRDFLVPSLVGARDDSDTDVYLAATKLWLGGAGGYNLLVNATLRGTRGNQTGLLGFGGDAGNRREWQGEVSAAVLLNPRWAIGAEFRQKPDNLGFAREDHWRDVFVGWFPNKRVAVVAAWADLGDIATLRDQEGWYVSLQLSH